MYKTLLFGTVVILVFSCAAVSQVPWIAVPVVNGSAGQYACITRPTYNQTIAIITCNPQIVGMYPPFAQSFLLAHEHGHVYQIVYNPQMLMSPYVEYDADCYAATYMVLNDTRSLALSIQWFRQVLGPYGGDAIHGNGFQMAQRAEECARSVNPNFQATLETVPTKLNRPQLANAFLDDSAVSRPVASYPKPKGMVKTSDTAFPDVRPDVEPTACTAIEYLIESSHTSFWEASDSTGGIATSISKALGASCRVTGPLRQKIECSRSKPNSTDLRMEFARCLDPKEWDKRCDDSSCTNAVYQHPADGANHVVIRYRGHEGSEAVELLSPAPVPHSHDSKDYDALK